MHSCVVVTSLRRIECVVTLTVLYIVSSAFADKLLRERLCHMLDVSHSCATFKIGKDSNLSTLLRTLVARQGNVIHRRLEKHGSDSYTLRYLGVDCACVVGVAN